MQITDTPVRGADERKRDLHKKHCEVVEKLRRDEFIKEPFTQNFIVDRSVASRWPNKDVRICSEWKG
jgi:hypothetical protein